MVDSQMVSPTRVWYTDWLTCNGVSQLDIPDVVPGGAGDLAEIKVKMSEESSANLENAARPSVWGLSMMHW
jgi:hypothetical protein